MKRNANPIFPAPFVRSVIYDWNIICNTIFVVLKYLISLPFIYFKQIPNQVIQFVWLTCDSWCGIEEHYILIFELKTWKEKIYIVILNKNGYFQLEDLIFDIIRTTFKINWPVFFQLSENGPV